MVLRRRSGGEQLRVIKGGGQGQSGTKREGIRRAPANIMLLILALFLLAQVLLGWLWGSVNRSAGRVVPAIEGSVDISVACGGILTFEEELVFAPQTGFVYYQVKGGERIPSGKELAVITTLPKEEPDTPVDDEKENGQAITEQLQRFRHWLLDDQGEADSLSAELLFPHDHETRVVSPRAGMISLKLDGWEMFGPQSSYVYLDDVDFIEQETDLQILSSGKKINRFAPILRIINNYQWYFSTVIPPDQGKLIGEESSVKLRFSFAPEEPVQAQIVEMNKKEEGSLEVTWRINRAVGDFYNHRWDTVEVIYDRIEGVFVPKDSILEQDGATGVYTVERGIVAFKEVSLLAEKDDVILVEGPNPHDRIIVRPGRVKVGQRFFW